MPSSVAGWCMAVLGAAVASAAVTEVGGLPVHGQVSPNAPLDERLAAAHTILHQTTLLAGPRALRWPLEGSGRVRRFNSSASNRAAAVLPGLADLRKAKVAAQMWSVQVPCGAQYRNAVQLLLEQLDALKRMINAQADSTRLVTSTQEIHEARATGIVGSVVSVGGGHSVGSSLGVLRSLPELGVTTLSLTHSCPTPWAESAASTGEAANTKGLTQFGKDLVVEMNRLGLLVDLGGSSSSTARDAMLVSRAPVIFSEAFTRAKCPTQAPTALPDHVISRLPQNGGVILVALRSGGNNSQNLCGHNNSVAAAVEHIKQVRNTAGIDHVGVGSTDSPNRYALLVAELLRDPAWPNAAIHKLLGGNLLRVMDAAHQIRDNMADNVPSEEIIPIHDIDDRWPCRYKFGSLPTR